MLLVAQDLISADQNTTNSVRNIAEFELLGAIWGSSKGLSEYAVEILAPYLLYMNLN